LDEEEEEEDEDEDEDEDVLAGDDAEMDSEDDDDDDEMEDGDEDEDDEEEDEENEDEEDEDEEEEGAAIGDDVGFDWDDSKKAGDSDDDDDDDDDAKEAAKTRSAAGTKRDKAREKAKKELEIHRREQNLRDAGDRAPETASEFEKLIMSSPKSSYAWLRFMAFQVSVGANDEAREVAERALKAIPASEEEERMNVWVAYLNLENMHGKPTGREALLRLFERAVKLANPKKLHLTLAGIYERSGQDEMAQQTLKTAVRKFSQSAKVWLAHIRAAIVLGGGGAGGGGASGGSTPDPEGVRRALDRATQSLPKRKHVKVLVQTALLEIREGSVERGRTMFESILRNYPRRTDIWSTYIDQEIKQGDADRIRALLERATHLELNPKSMKFLFKRYLDFERGGGDRDRVEHVKSRAMEYVQSKFGGLE